MLTVGTCLASIRQIYPDILTMTPPEKPSTAPDIRAFSLVEMAAALAILAILMTAGVSLMGSSGPRARAASVEKLAAMIERARAAAITRRCHIVLAIAGPGDLPGVDEHCRIGLFQVDAWPESSSDELHARPLGRWQSLDSGTVLIGGTVDGLENPLDAENLEIIAAGAKTIDVRTHALAFNPHGGLHHPPGSAPVILRVAEGHYRNGRALPHRRADSGGYHESILKIGRVTARAHRLDG
jgi:prepilin-type N-terminal cleavage/methylation domain-containing protein